MDRMRTMVPPLTPVRFTGGEPLLQLDEDWAQVFLGAGFPVAVETNGTQPLPPSLVSSPLSWVTVSPKSAEHTIVVSRADEVRYVRRRDQGIPKPENSVLRDCLYKYISPAFQPDGSVKREDLDWCIDLVKTHPAWRLSVQMHKLWGVR